MSLAQIRRAWAAPCETPGQRLVLLALADHANDKGRECYPSQHTLSRLTTLSERHVRTVLAELISVGLVTVARPASARQSASYVLNLPEATSTPEASSPEASSPQGGSGNGLDRKSTPFLPEVSSANPSESLRDPKNAHAREGEDDRKWLPPPMPKAQIDSFREQCDALDRERAQRAERARLASETASTTSPSAPQQGESISAVSPPEP